MLVRLQFKPVWLVSVIVLFTCNGFSFLRRALGSSGEVERREPEFTETSTGEEWNG